MNHSSFSETSESVSGYSVHVRTWQHALSKQVLVLVHGIGVSSKYFIPFAEELAKKYTVIALDLPGYGKAGKPPKPLTIRQLAEVVLAYIETKGIQKPVLVGHSMGCQIIAHANAMNPDFFDALILLSPTVYSKERSILTQGLRLLQDSFIEPPKVNRIIMSDYLKMGIRRYLQTAHWMVEDKIEETLLNNATPSLIIRGDRDPIVPQPWVATLVSLSPHHQQEIIPASPHVFQFNYPRLTAESVSHFLTKK